MASNWSQVYLNLSNKVSRKDPQIALAYLDTALQYDQKYLPAYLGHAQLKIDTKDFKEAEEWLKKAEANTSGYLEQAEQTFKTLPVNGDPFYQADYFYTSGKLLGSASKKDESMVQYEKAIAANPYLFDAYAELIRIHIAAGQQAKANKLQARMADLGKNVD